MTILETDIIKLRALEPSDIDLIYELENDPSVWFVSNTLTPFSKYILKKYIKNSHLDIYQTRQLRLMIDVKADNTKTIGTIDLFDFDPYHNRAGVAILISKTKDRKKGYATEALSIFIQYAFNILGLHQLYCNITTDNEASIKLFQKHGFKIIGEKKEWLKTSEGWIGEYLLQLVNKKAKAKNESEGGSLQ